MTQIEKAIMTLSLFLRFWAVDRSWKTYSKNSCFAVSHKRAGSKSYLHLLAGNINHNESEADQVKQSQERKWY